MKQQVKKAGYLPRPGVVYIPGKGNATWTGKLLRRRICEATRDSGIANGWAIGICVVKSTAPGASLGCRGEPRRTKVVDTVSTTSTRIVDGRAKPDGSYR